MSGQGQLKGLYTLAASDVFRMLQTYGSASFEIRVSFFEIYGSKVRSSILGQKYVSTWQAEARRLLTIIIENIVVIMSREF